MSAAATEFVPQQYGYQSAEAIDFPPIIILENTTVCNLRCIHCPQGQGYPEREDYRAVYMPWDVYTKAIDEISKHKITLLRYSPAGEALIHPQFIDQVRYAKEKGISPVNLTTNGLTLDNPAIENGKRTNKTFLERLLELGIDIIDISVDAANREAYERIRVGSNYHRLWSNIHRLLYLRERMKAPTKLMLSIIDQPESHEEVQEFVKYWTPYVDRVIVRPYLENLGLTPHKPGTVVETLNGVKRWPCPQFWKRITIAPEGYIRFCVVDWLDHTKLGHVRTHSIQEIWQSDEYNRMRNCHTTGKYGDAHDICGPCTDWMGMRWEWGFEKAVSHVMGKEVVSNTPPPMMANLS